MKKHLVTILCLAVAIFTLSSPVVAAPIVLTGSTYTFYLEGAESNNAFLGRTVFDDVAGTTIRAGLLLTVTENEIALGGGRSRIRINIAADGDLFPALNETAGLAIGVDADADGLDLLLAVTLDDVRLTFSDAAGNTVLVSDNLAGEVTERSPWTGFFPARASAIGLDNIGGRGVSNISFDFFVSEMSTNIPEPSTALLGLIGLTGAFATRRRQRKPVSQA